VCVFDSHPVNYNFGVVHLAKRLSRVVLQKMTRVCLMVMDHMDLLLAAKQDKQCLLALTLLLKVEVAVLTSVGHV